MECLFPGIDTFKICFTVCHIIYENLLQHALAIPNNDFEHLIYDLFLL